MFKKNKTVKIAAIILMFVLALSLTLIVGTDTNWGKVEISKLTLITPDGDEISALLYKPYAANEQNKVPLAMITHGGSDMLEQMGTYALELARRGYAAVTWDYTGSHNSDIATGTSETANREKSGGPTMGAETVWNTVKTFNFVDFDKIITMGHSMGGQYTHVFAIEHQEEVFLQVNLGMNYYGKATNQDHNFNFANILGVADESTLARSNNNVRNTINSEQLRRIFTADYTSEAAALPEIEIGKVYTVTGTNGKEYHRTQYMPDSCHAYYLVTQDAVQTVIYAITSEVGIGLDAGVKSYADYKKISTVWQWKELGFFLLLAGTVGIMFVTSAALLSSPQFQSLKLKKRDYPSLKAGSPIWIITLIVMMLMPVILYRPGVLASRNFLGLNVSKLWLVGGNNNAYISWQWMVSIAFLAIFLIYHIAYGYRKGGRLINYGFATGDDNGFHIGYVAKAFLFGLLTVTSGYLVFSFLTGYTKQGMHIATFMLSTVNVNRTLCVVMYFLFQIPYFLTSSMAMRAIGVDKTEDNLKGTLKTIGLGMLVNVGLLFALWLGFIICVCGFHTLTSATYFSSDRMYIYTIAILPLFIGMSIANALNIFVSKKTNSIWTGLFTALFWGAWTIISCGGMSKYFY